MGDKGSKAVFGIQRCRLPIDTGIIFTPFITVYNVYNTQNDINKIVILLELTSLFGHLECAFLK